MDLDAVYDVLRNQRRRLVLHYLIHDSSETARIGNLAEQLAAWENQIPLSAVNSTLRKRTYNTLQQHHLPKLDDMGLVSFDRHRGEVQLTANERQLRLLLEVWPKVNPSRITGFLIIGTIFWLLFTINWFGVHVMQTIPPGYASPLFGVSFVVLLFAHGYLLYRFIHPRLVYNRNDALGGL